MGNSASIEPTTPEDIFAFKVVKRYYDKISSHESVSGKHVVIKDSEVTDRLQNLYIIAKAEANFSIVDCSVPGVISLKYELMSLDEKKYFHKAVVLAAINREKASKPISATPAATDYSKSFSGTSQDSNEEKDASALFRGVSGIKITDSVKEDNPYLKVPMFTEHDNIEGIILRETGRWKRFMGSQCYMYIHVLTKEMVSVRPDDYVEDETDVNTEASNTVKSEKDLYNGLPVVTMSELKNTIDRIVNEEKKTPLIIDTSDEQISRTFYSYKATLEDVSQLALPFAKTGLKRNDVVERCRRGLVSALKNGGTFVLYLGAATSEHADWRKKLCRKDLFPIETFYEAGSKLLLPASNPKFKQIFKEEDLESGQAVARDGFRVIVITTLTPATYQTLLDDGLPLNQMFPFSLIKD